MFKLRQQGIGIAGPDKTCLEPGDIPPLPTITQDVYVSALYGNDLAGNGSEATPYATISHALSVIIDAAVTKTYRIIVLNGGYADPLALKPWIMIQGVSPELVQLFGALTLDPLFADPAMGPTAWVVGCDVQNQPQLDFVAIVSSTGLVVFSGCYLDSAVTLTMDSSNVVWGYECRLSGDVNQLGGTVKWINCNNISAGANLLVQASATSGAESQWFGGAWYGSVRADQNGSAQNCLIQSFGCNMSRGLVSLIATAAVCPAINAACGDLGENVSLMGGAAKQLSLQMRISHQFPDFAPNPTPIGANGVTTLALTDVGLQTLLGATSIGAMQMGTTLLGAGVADLLGNKCSVWYSYSSAPNTVNVHIYNPGLGFNITQRLDLNVQGYLPGSL